MTLAIPWPIYTAAQAIIGVGVGFVCAQLYKAIKAEIEHNKQRDNLHNFLCSSLEDAE